jgi:preprotein translocase subunit SecA
MTVRSVFKAFDTTRLLNTQEIAERARRCRGQAMFGEPLEKLGSEVFALVMAATQQLLGITHYRVQIQGAIAIFRGRIAEMQTGEGKTITAVPPVALRAMSGYGVHVLTSNEYLAMRDADLLRPIYELLGLSVATVTRELSDEQRRAAYSSDIVYTTASEVGFDFLRDRLRQNAADDLATRKLYFAGNNQSANVLRSLHFAMVDEADSILVDEAQTPLIIGAQRAESHAKEQLYAWAQTYIECCQRDRDYRIHLDKKRVELTQAGCRRVTLAPKPQQLDGLNNETIYQHVEKAISARDLYVRDIHYLVHEDQTIAIIGEGSGRLMTGRKWQDGLHQAIEVKEGMPLSEGGFTAASAMLQTFFRRYEHLAGMTGTAVQAKREFRRDYRLRVSVIPTNRPCIRKRYPDRVFLTRVAKYQAIARAVREQIAIDRAILIGTPSVDTSEELSLCLHELQIKHRVLNCRQHAEESNIVAMAGIAGAVTIATNMAGRGTDILLDAKCRQAGGLHVIATERHSSFRIDRQLIGRSARQGDPGSFQFFLSFDDELLRVVEPRRIQRWRKRLSLLVSDTGELPARFASRFHRCQSRLSRLQSKSRRQTIKQEKQRLKEHVKMSLDPFVELLNQ